MICAGDSHGKKIHKVCIFRQFVRTDSYMQISELFSIEIPKKKLLQIKNFEFDNDKNKQHIISRQS